ncbi:hypothetical protein ACWJJH_00080 [Endozoicomonadaceae bacterium StTr2]
MNTNSDSYDSLAHIISNLPDTAPLRVAIDGVDASGKTWLADKLASLIPDRPVIRSSIDYFHQPRAIRYRQGDLSAKGYLEDSFNYEALTQCLLEPLSPDGSRQYQLKAFDHYKDKVVCSDTLVAAENSILLLDGIFLQVPEIKNYWDLVIFVDVDFSYSLPRAIARNQEQADDIQLLKKRYLQRYIPGQQLYFEQCDPRERADIVINNNDLTCPTLEFNRDIRTEPQ